MVATTEIVVVAIVVVVAVVMATAVMEVIVAKTRQQWYSVCMLVCVCVCVCEACLLHVMRVQLNAAPTQLYNVPEQVKYFLSLSRLIVIVY